LSDRQAADQVRARIDWKYALGLELTNEGFDYSILSEFRSRLIAVGREHQLLDEMLKRFSEKGWIKARGRARTDSTHILAAIRQLNRLECVGETLRCALNEFATVAPDWLLAQVEAEWFERYSSRFEQYRLPKTQAEQQRLARTIGEDGHHLLSAIYAESTPVLLRKLPAVGTLRAVWVQQYYLEAFAVEWRKPEDLPPNKQLIYSPNDPEARNRTKRDINWTGYSVHLTETCDAETPHLIPHVSTTPATTGDVEMTGVIHSALADKDLLPGEHIVDTGYVSAQHLVDSPTDYSVDLVGPVPPDTSWQALANQGFDISCFTGDWESECAICPMGCKSKSWSRHSDNYDNPVIKVRFNPRDCRACTSREQCTRSPKLPRVLTLKPFPEYQALKKARLRQATEEFKKLYAKRAGVEGTISQGVRAFELRRTRYIGLAKTHLQHIATATAINFSRLWNWLRGVPVAQTRTSRFAALATRLSHI
jgi:transposase